ncbi:kinase-like domain-containing protein [Crassisporium funariophilum]|nr:kinase-like domain-containing protein [Crassisporium funariophilum]
MIELLTALQIAALALKTARETIPRLQGHQDRCNLLIERCQRLLANACDQVQTGRASKMQRELNALQSVCIAVRDTVIALSERGISWRLFNKDRIEQSFKAAEAQLNDAFLVFDVGAQLTHGRLQDEIAAALQRDRQELLRYLEQLLHNSQTMVETLEEKPRESTHQVTPKLDWQIPRHELTLCSDSNAYLGLGGLGKVTRCQWGRKVVAVKEIHVQSVQFLFNSRSNKKAFEDKMSKWLHLRHPNVIEFLGACFEAEQPLLVSSHCRRGNVMTYIQNYPRCNKLMILRHVCAGMVYLHGQSSIQANILIGEDHGAKISDFELSALTNDAQMSGSSSQPISKSWNYWPPEYLEGESFEYPGDVYSFAMTAWEIHTGCVPLSLLDWGRFCKQIIVKKERPPYPESMCQHLWSLLQRCWSHKPCDRPSFLEAESCLKGISDPCHIRKATSNQAFQQMFKCGHKPDIMPVGIIQPIRPGVPSISGVYQSHTTTLPALEEHTSFDNLVGKVLICYPNWNTRSSARGQRPHFTYKVFLHSSQSSHLIVTQEEAKRFITRYKELLSGWVDNIPLLSGAEISNGFRTLVFITVTCITAELCHRADSEAPYLYINRFTEKTLLSNDFKAFVEISAEKVWCLKPKTFIDPVIMEVVPALQVAGLALKTAREQIPALQAHRERCTLLINRCQRLLDEVSVQCESERASSMQKKLDVLESACLSVRDTITEVSGKGLAWRLLHQERMEQALAAAEAKLTDAFFSFNVGAHVVIGEIQAEIADASQRDHQQLISYLESISQNDHKIIDALRANNLRLEETRMALMKHLQARRSTEEHDQPSEMFMRRAVTALQKASSGPVSTSIPLWQITSFEVAYDGEEIDCLGTGGFGKVFKGRWHGECIRSKYSEEHLSVRLRLNHPRIVPFYGACLEAKKPFLVTKYCPNGNVMDYIREYPEANRLLIANILMGDDDKALICDFGLSLFKDQVNTSQSNSHVLQGTLNYMAPEYLDGNPIDYPADVYSFAMTVWQIHTGLVPFSEVPRRSFQRWVIDKQERPEYPNSMNKALWTLIRQCWQHDASKRPPFTEVEASLQNLMEPYKDTNQRFSRAASQMLMYSHLPTPPISMAPSVISPVSPASPISLDNEWFSLPPTPVLHPVSSNSLEVFRSTLHALHEIMSLDDLIHTTLLCYPKWWVIQIVPTLLQENRVKDQVREFKRALLSWIDNIPSLRGADALNVYRTLLLITSTCAMAEYTFRRNPEAPHLYVQDFVQNAMATSAFRATVEGSARTVWEQYKERRDGTELGERLAQVVNQVYALR